jgi:hypothetical protein
LQSLKAKMLIVLEKSTTDDKLISALRDCKDHSGGGSGGGGGGRGRGNR